MKKMFFVFCAFCLTVKGMCFSSFPSFENPFFDYRIVEEGSLLVGREAPFFETYAVVDGKIIDDFSLDSFKGQHIVLVFYPLDFTFVCPTELHAFQEKLGEFTKRNAQVIACSVDSVYSHLAWLNTPREMGGIAGIEYPLISDLDKSISRDYQVLDEKTAIAYRGLVIIDDKGIVRHYLVNDLPLGRNVDEVLRILDALSTHDKSGEVCPANWKSGDKTLKPTSEGRIEYFGK